jgi:hypothetical protein
MLQDNIEERREGRRGEERRGSVRFAPGQRTAEGRWRWQMHHGHSSQSRVSGGRAPILKAWVRQLGYVREQNDGVRIDHIHAPDSVKVTVGLGVDTKKTLAAFRKAPHGDRSRVFECKSQ